MLFSPCVSYRRIRSASPSHVLPRRARPRARGTAGLGRAGLALPAALQLSVGGGDDRSRRVVVDQLRVDVAVGPVHGQARALRRTRDLAPDPGVATDARLDRK